MPRVLLTPTQRRWAWLDDALREIDIHRAGKQALRHDSAMSAEAGVSRALMSKWRTKSAFPSLSPFARICVTAGMKDEEIGKLIRKLGEI